MGIVPAEKDLGEKDYLQGLPIPRLEISSRVRPLPRDRRKECPSNLASGSSI